MSGTRTAVLAAALLGCAAGVHAQTVTRQSIDLATARKIVAAAEAEATKNNWALSIAVVDNAGKLVYFQRMDETPLGTIEVAQGKAETAVNFRMPTGNLAQAVAQGGGMLTIRNMVALPGGYPIMIDGKLVGAIGVSGGMRGEDDLAAAAALKVLEKK